MSMRQEQSNCKFNSSFFLMAAILILANVPIWLHSFWPGHDSLWVTSRFCAFYSDFFLNQELTRWIPYGTYGLQGDYLQMISFTPASYFVGFLGWLFQAKDAFLLFKLSVLFEEFTLLVGIYLLSKVLFRNEAARFFVCCGILLSTVWLYQIHWNFRIYYLLPYALYFLILAFKKARPHYLWLSVTSVIVSLFGNVPYYLPLYILISLFFFVPLAIKQPKLLTAIFERSKPNLIFFVLMLLIAFTTAYFMAGMMQGIKSYTIGRDSAKHTVDLNTFLTYGAHAQLNKFLGFFFATGGTDEQTFYIGFIPFLFFLYGLLRVRQIVFFSVVFTFFFLVLFSLGSLTFVASLTYRLFPLMHYFRYIGLTGGLLRFFLLIAAGFGLDAWLNSLKSDQNESLRLKARKSLFFLGFAVWAFLIYLGFKNANGKPFADWRPSFYDTALILLGVSILGLWKPYKPSSKIPQMIVVVCLLLDLALYRYWTFAGWPYNWLWIKPDVGKIHRSQFQETRSNWQDMSGWTKASFEVIQASGVSVTGEIYNMIQFDPCFPTMYGLENVEEFIVTRIPALRYQTNGELVFKNPSLPSFLRAVGCGTPKLRLITDVLFAENDKQAVQLIRSMPEVDQHVVLSHVPQKIQKDWNASPHFAPQGNIHVESFAFNRLNFDATVENPEGAWLYYADGYHPGWRAFVDRKETPIFKANLGFKAVYLSHGKHQVQFKFFDGLRGMASVAIALSGLIFSAIILIVFTKLVFPDRKSPAFLEPYFTR